jgi:hypothetical protein
VRLGNEATVRRAQSAYQRLIERIRGAGFQVEAYQLPMVVDDRLSQTRLFQRAMGVLDVEVEREVLMLYSSLAGWFGAGVIARYAPHSRAVAVGSTGGGIDDFPKLTWEQLERDLLLAARHVSHLFVFSLEGCVRRGFLERIEAMDWERPVESPWMANAVSKGINWMWRAVAASRSVLGRSSNTGGS